MFCRLDAINSEIRLIQQEKTHAERVAEQLESRAARAVNNSDAMNASGIYDDSGQTVAGGANLSSARSTPRNSPQHDFLVTKYNTVSPLFVCVYRYQKHHDIKLIMVITLLDSSL